MHLCPGSNGPSCARPSSDQVPAYLRQAESLCQQRGERLTALRRRVLELVCQKPSPVGAYGLLDELRKERRSAAPPTVYRVLDFLQQQGLIHRLATNNTFMACAHPQLPHAGVFLVCNRCEQVQELHTNAVSHVVGEIAQNQQFQVQQQTVEVSGLCRDCQQDHS